MLISKVDRPAPPSASMTGTVLALIAQGTKRLARGDRVYEYRAGQHLRLVRLLDRPRDRAVLGPLAIRDILWP